MTSLAKHFATYDDILALPDNVVGEIVNGDLLVSPRPASPHTYTASVLGADIGSPFFRGRGGPGGWVILVEPELHFGNDVLVPDFAGWRRERMPHVPNVPYFTLAPDWVCEIVSPSTERYDRIAKMRAYARAAVAHIWLVSPNDRTLEIYRLDADANWVLIRNFGSDAGDDIIRAEPFDAVELQLSALWAPVSA